MTAWRKLAVMGAVTTMLGGCMHHGGYETSSGEVAVDSLSATRTALLRVDNSTAGEVRVYTKLPGMDASYAARSMPGDVRTTVLDPNLFPAEAMSFELRPADGSPSRTLGPFKVYKNQVVDIVIPSDINAARATVHQSTP
jgi:hypothetical protein